MPVTKVRSHLSRPHVIRLKCFHACSVLPLVLFSNREKMLSKRTSQSSRYDEFFATSGLHVCNDSAHFKHLVPMTRVFLVRNKCTGLRTWHDGVMTF
jgi:hypothetical protein